ncbi:MAG: aspartate carbamoyltransferase catalytic subunit [Actinobacteria bacterium]|nr:aspartate carbamoyltransferase catalytic subunit [Actinomycetota bacterium]
MGREGIEEVLDLADSFAEVSRRPIPKVPALRGRTVATLFYEDSTRTRLSFEAAAKRLSADTMSFSLGTSSVNKGESLLDTARTLESLGADVLVVRHPSAGAPSRVASWVGVPVINAGDGWHEHPTQALLDCYTLTKALGRRSVGKDRFGGLSVAVVGDVLHSRVARSVVKAFAMLGAAVSLVAPPTMLPSSLEGWPLAGFSYDLDPVLAGADVLYMLRVQAERGAGSFVPSVREYVSRYGLNMDRFRKMKPDAVILHPGPVNRGVELAPEVADQPSALIASQVANGIVVRMAVLYLLLGSAGNQRDLEQDSSKVMDETGA